MGLRIGEQGNGEGEREPGRNGCLTLPVVSRVVSDSRYTLAAGGRAGWLSLFAGGEFIFIFIVSRSMLKGPIEKMYEKSQKPVPPPIFC